MTTQQSTVGFYVRPAAMTSPGRHAALFEGLPRDIPGLVKVVQGLMLHEHISPEYGVTLSDERRSETHLRSVEAILDRVLAHDSRPLTDARTVEDRVIGTCRDFTLLTVSTLRSQGVPARGRCGFGTYFEAGKLVDHWVAEYWNESQGRWVMVDAQIDELQVGLFKPGFDLLDVPRDRFVIAGDAWAQCRAGKADPSKFGIMDMNGLWFIAGDLVRDVAALNNMEMLPWDSWGAMPGPDGTISEERLAFFDRLATMTHNPDETFEELRAVYEGEEGLKVPQVVLNAVLNREEAL